MTNALKKSAATRLRILDAAAKTFRQKGYAATRLSDIARAAELQPGSIYYHFDSKEQILEEVLDIGLRRVFEAVRAEVAGLGPTASHRRRITVALQAHLAMLLKHGDYTSANIRIFGQVPKPVQRRHLKLRRAYDDYWRELLAAAQRAGALRSDADLTLARMFLIGALNWSIEWYSPTRRSIADIAEAFSGFVFDGIGEAAANQAGD